MNNANKVNVNQFCGLQTFMHSVIFVDVTEFGTKGITTRYYRNILIKQSASIPQQKVKHGKKNVKVKTVCQTTKPKYKIVWGSYKIMKCHKLYISKKQKCLSRTLYQQNIILEDEEMRN